MTDRRGTHPPAPAAVAGYAALMAGAMRQQEDETMREMTPGERMVWAVKYVRALDKQLDEGLRYNTEDAALSAAEYAVSLSDCDADAVGVEDSRAAAMLRQMRGEG